jgi:hypothetical protein
MEPRQWFRSFEMFYRSRLADRQSEIWFSDPSDDDQAGWTDVMGLTLSRFARIPANKCIQHWEKRYDGTRRRFDFGWKRGRSRSWSVLIEHESWYTSARRRRLDEQLLKLRSSGSALKVLITYADSEKAGRGRKGYLESVNRTLRRFSSTRGRFLLILGNDCLDRNLPWSGYVWDGRVGGLAQISRV